MKRLLTKVVPVLLALGCTPLGHTTSLANLSEARPLLQPQIDAVAIYTKACTRCHGDDGRAETKKGKQLRATDFTSTRWQKGITDAKGIRVISQGHEEMPAFKDTLNADEIRAVMSYLRKFKKE